MNPLTHIGRTLQWQIRKAVPTPAETAALEEAGTDDAVLSSYAVWRRSSLAVAALFLVAASVLSIMSILQTDLTPFNRLGFVLLWVNALSIPFLTITVILAAIRWTQSTRSHRLLLVGWTVSFAIPLMLSLLPIRWVLDGQLYTDEDLSAFSTIQALVNSLALLPVLATFPAGVLRGSLRAKGVLPTAVMPGWFLIGAVPFYGLVFIASLSVVDQIAASVLLFSGIALLAIAPWYFAFKRETFVRPALTDGDMAEMARVQRVIGVMVLAAVALVTTWALTSQIEIFGVSLDVVGRGEQALFDPLNALTSVGELVGRWMTTTILYTHVFIRSVARSWRHEEALRSSDQLEAHRDLMARTEQALSSQPGPATTGSPTL